MKALAMTVLIAASLTAAAEHASANELRCSTAAMAGEWIFATGIGRQMLGGPFPPDKDITALGRFTVHPDGNISGVFDVTVEDFLFFPQNTVVGSLVVNSDCLGILTFETSAGTARTDSIAVVSRREMLGMTQDPANLWTYQVRKISGIARQRDDN